MARIKIRILGPKLWRLYKLKGAKIFKMSHFFATIQNSFIRKLDLDEVSFIAVLDEISL